MLRTLNRYCAEPPGVEHDSRPRVARLRLETPGAHRQRQRPPGAGAQLRAQAAALGAERQHRTPGCRRRAAARPPGRSRAAAGAPPAAARAARPAARSAGRPSRAARPDARARGGPWSAPRQRRSPPRPAPRRRGCRDGSAARAAPAAHRPGRPSRRSRSAAGRRGDRQTAVSAGARSGARTAPAGTSVRWRASQAARSGARRRASAASGAAGRRAGELDRRTEAQRVLERMETLQHGPRGIVAGASEALDQGLLRRSHPSRSMRALWAGGRGRTSAPQQAAGRRPAAAGIVLADGRVCHAARPEPMSGCNRRANNAGWCAHGGRNARLCAGLRLVDDAVSDERGRPRGGVRASFAARWSRSTATCSRSRTRTRSSARSR